MKVIFTFGGLPHYYNLVLNKLNAVPGLEVIVVAPEEKGKSLGSGVHESTEGIDFRVVRLPEQKAWYGKPAFNELGKLISKEKPDAIITTWPYALAFLYNPFLLLTVKRTGTKLIYKDIPFNIPKYQEARKYYREQQVLLETLENREKNKFIQGLKYDLVTLTRKIYFNIMDAHVNYTPEAYEVFGSYGVKKEKIFITYNSVDTDHLLAVKEKVEKTSPLLPANPFRLLHVGRLVKWKRVDMIIDILPDLIKKFPETELVVIGNGPEEETLKKQVSSKGLENKVIFTGAIYDSEELGRYFMDSSIYILAGMGGLSINEAMCFGKPVICSIADGTEKTLVREDFNGKYFQNGNARDLYDKIEYLLSRQDLILEYGKNSLSIIENEINIHTVIKGYVKAFNYVSKGKYKLEYTR